MEEGLTRVVIPEQVPESSSLGTLVGLAIVGGVGYYYFIKERGNPKYLKPLQSCSSGDVKCHTKPPHGGTTGDHPHSGKGFPPGLIPPWNTWPIFQHPWDFHNLQKPPTTTPPPPPPQTWKPIGKVSNPCETSYHF